MTTATPSLQVRRQRETLVDISEKAVELFAVQGFTATTVQDVASAAGVSVRTFHRYFATKEDAVAPVLDAGWRAFVAVFATRPPEESALDSLVAAMQEAFDGVAGRRHRTFLRALPASPALEPVWLRVNYRCEKALQPFLAARLKLDPLSIRAQYASACVVAANRLTVETWARQPRTPVLKTAQEILGLIDAALLRPAG